MANRTYRFGDFELSEARFELARGGVALHVQPKVLDLLLYLVRHRDRAVPKAELLSAVWPDVVVSEASLDKAVAGARRALGDARRHIVTVRGRGFRFVAAVREHETAAPHRAAGAVAADFVGRRDVLAAAASTLASARRGAGRLMLLAGEAGMGKTRTAQEIAASCRDAGLRVVTAWCHEGEGAPSLWPWAQVLRQVVAEGDEGALVEGLGEGLADLLALVPALASHVRPSQSRGPLDPEQARFRLLDTATEMLRRTAAVQPLLVVLDDVHRADGASLALLGFLSRELAHSRMVVLVTYREEELADGSPLFALRRQATSLALALEGLAPDETTRLAAIETGGPVDERVGAAIHEVSEGNPLFVKELARALRARGGLGSPAALGAMPLPAGVMEALRERLDRLSPACRDVLVPAALIGRDVDAALVARVAQVETARVQALLGEALAARVVADRPGGWGFAHALVREALVTRLAAADKARLHRQIGEALEAHHRGDIEPYLGALAHHFAAGAPSGGVERALDYTRRAGDRAARLLAHGEAAAHYRRALELLAALGSDDELQECELLLALGGAQLAAGESREGRATLRRAVEIARRLRSSELLGQAALAAGGLRFTTEVGVEDPELTAWIEEALGTLPTAATPLRAQLLARLMVARAWGHEWEGGGDLAGEAVEAARRSCDPQALAYALYVRRWTRLPPGELDARLADSDEMLGLARASELRELDLAARSCRFLDLMECGRVADADHELRLYERLVAEARVPRYRWRAHFYRGMRALCDGRFADAEELILGVLAQEERFMPRDAGQVFGGQIAMLRREQGRTADIQPVLEAAVERFPALWVWRAMLALAHADAGRADKARELLGVLAEGDFTRLPKGLNWVVGLVILAEVCAALGDRACALRLYDLLRPCSPRVVMGGAGVVCWGSLDRHLGLLAAATGRWEAAERHFAAAVETNARIGARPWVGWTEYDRASMLALRNLGGDRARAREHLDRARAVGEALGMVRLAGRVGELEARLQ